MKLVCYGIVMMFPLFPLPSQRLLLTTCLDFLNNEYKLRCLDSDDDISYIYDAVKRSGFCAADKA